MKRNESVLVYAVTGLLLVILLVAVIFGEQPAHAGLSGGDPNAPGTAGTGSGVKIAQLPGVAPAETPALGPGGEGGGTGEGSGPESRLASDTAPSETYGPQPETPAASVASPPAGATADPATVPAPAAEKMALERRDVVAAPATILAGLLGASTRSGAYRVVQARANDTLEKIVQRWCASTEHLEATQGLNEHLVESSFQAGREVVVPFVEPAVLIEAEKSRRARVAKIDFAKGEPYSLKKGDSLWKLASKRVAANMIPAWLQRFRQLNPEITNPDVLVEGQKIRLPR